MTKHYCDACGNEVYDANVVEVHCWFHDSEELCKWCASNRKKKCKVCDCVVCEQCIKDFELTDECVECEVERRYGDIAAWAKAFVRLFGCSESTIQKLLDVSQAENPIHKIAMTRVIDDVRNAKERWDVSA